MRLLQNEPVAAPGAIAATLLFADLADEQFRAVLDAISWSIVESGDWLVRQGDAGDSMFVVVSGRLAVQVNGRLVREVGRGAMIGELALLTGTPRTASVTAIRDSIVGSISKPVFETLVKEHPEFAMRLARVVANWLLGDGVPVRSAAPRTICVLPMCGAWVGDQAQILVDSLAEDAVLVDAEEVDRYLGSSTSRAADVTEQLANYLDSVEAHHSTVVYLADPQPDSMWTVRALRQADRVLVVVDSTGNPRDRAFLAMVRRIEQTVPEVPVELIVLNSGSPIHPVTAGWLQSMQFVRHHHVSINSASQWARVGRFLNGTATGLVLGGGGARGLAHIGVLKALAEIGVTIDAVGGTSMGAMVAAQWACGFSVDQMIAQHQRMWLQKSLLRGMTFPLVAILSDRRFEDAGVDIFGDRRIEDLPIHFFCVTANLSRNAISVHRSGLLRKYVQASMSLPGFAPPVVDDGDLLVDGGVVNNLPTDVMRELGAENLIAVNVSSDRTMAVHSSFERAPSGADLVMRRIRGDGPWFPTILRILERASTLGSQHHISIERGRGDVTYIEPSVKHFDTFNMKRIHEIVDIGYRDTMAQMSRKLVD